MDFSQMPLQINIVPKTAWYKNLRTYFSENEWRKIRKYVYKRANYQCEICGGVGKKHKVEAHEEWIYDDENHIQKLDRIYALCPACHLCKHPGYAKVNYRQKEVVEQLMKVNKYDLDAANQQIREAMAVYLERSNHEWTLDNDQLMKIKQWLDNH